MKQANKMLSDKALSDFSSQLSMILNAGLSLTEGLGMISEDAQTSREQQLLQGLKDTLEETGSFSAALESAGVFPSYMVEMVNLGEQTGHLEDVMNSLAEHYDRSDSIRQSIRSAVFYPLLMFCMLVITVVVLLTTVMPIFNQVFLQLGSELSGLSQVLLNLGMGIKNSGLILVALAAAFIAAGLGVGFNAKARAGFVKAFSHLRFMRRLYDTLFRFRFSSGMKLALSSGTDPEYALDMIKALTDDPVSLNRLEACKASLTAGQDFADALSDSEILPGSFGRMAAIGQRTGTMEQVMGQIARACQEDFDQKISRMLSRIEPTLIIILSVIIGTILLSVMFPLLGLLAGM